MTDAIFTLRGTGIAASIVAVSSGWGRVSEAIVLIHVNNSRRWRAIPMCACRDWHAAITRPESAAERADRQDKASTARTAAANSSGRHRRHHWYRMALRSGVMDWTDGQRREKQSDGPA
ncbi:MAG: hypothetical protein ACOC0P_06460 [Planctomycetota bacterium]